MVPTTILSWAGHVRNVLLTVDSLINILLGGLLLFFSPSLAEALGVPPADIGFYPGILGGVLVGIGIALLLDLRGASAHARGLGLHGAVAINLCGGFALMGWLVWGDLRIPLRGWVFLWALSAVLVVISMIEILAERLTSP
jgi:hypothetical protein